MTTKQRTVTQGGSLLGQPEITISQLLSNNCGRDTERGSFPAVTIPVIGLLLLEAGYPALGTPKSDRAIEPVKALLVQVGIVSKFGAGEVAFVEAAKQICSKVAMTLNADHVALVQCDGQAVAAAALEFVSGYIESGLRKIESPEVLVSKPTGVSTFDQEQIERAKYFLLAEAYTKQGLLAIPGTSRRSVWALVYAAHLLEAKLMEPAFDLPKVVEFLAQVEEIAARTIPAIDSSFADQAVAFCDSLNDLGIEASTVVTEIEQALPGFKPSQTFPAQFDQLLDFGPLFAQVGIDDVIALVQNVKAARKNRIPVTRLFASITRGQLPSNMGRRPANNARRETLGVGANGRPVGAGA